MVDRTISQGSDYDLILIPGGDSAPVEKPNAAINEWIVEASDQAEIVIAVCTGTVLLATTGVLDGRRATTNKKDFRATVPFGPKVDWVPEARWVEDGKFFTSSGVAAGIDMSLAVMARLFGEEAAESIAVGTEYDWHRDAGWDPFAKLAGRADQDHAPRHGRGAGMCAVRGRLAPDLARAGARRRRDAVRRVRRAGGEARVGIGRRARPVGLRRRDPRGGVLARHCPRAR